MENGVKMIALFVKVWFVLVNMKCFFKFESNVVIGSIEYRETGGRILRFASRERFRSV